MIASIAEERRGPRRGEGLLGVTANISPLAAHKILKRWKLSPVPTGRPGFTRGYKDRPRPLTGYLSSNFP